MSKMFAAGRVAFAMASPGHGATLTSLPESLDPFPQPNSEVVGCHAERGHATLCTTMADFLHDAPETDSRETGDLGVETLAELLDALERVLVCVDEHRAGDQSQ